ncbi:MAG: hypothetical protein E7319_02905 [Clostridiales bacterium]|nr:hypothetical protein [Clostridiales bacterium]
MQYHLETIPVWEAMEAETPCPFCYLKEKLEINEVERSLGGSVMEPDSRIRVNKTGICAHHHTQLFAMHNRLGHALLCDSHSKEILETLDKVKVSGKSGRGLFSSSATACEKLAQELDALASGCVICEDIASHMKRYLYTFIHLWKTDRAFLRKWEESNGLCFPHAIELLQMASRQLGSSQEQQFAQAVLDSMKKTLSVDESDLEWFTLKFDYRNQQKPWGNSRNALERTVNRLRGKCVSSTEN